MYLSFSFWLYGIAYSNQALIFFYVIFCLCIWKWLFSWKCLSFNILHFSHILSTKYLFPVNVIIASGIVFNYFNIILDLTFTHLVDLIKIIKKLNNHLWSHFFAMYLTAVLNVLQKGGHFRGQLMFQSGSRPKKTAVSPKMVTLTQAKLKWIVNTYLLEKLTKRYFRCLVQHIYFSYKSNRI